MTYSTFYVLNGLLDGTKGVLAQSTDERQLADGHYYLLEDEVDGHGPYHSHDEAFAAAKQAFHTQYWAFPLDPHDTNKPFRYELKDDPSEQSDCNTAVIVLGEDQVYTASIDGSYDTLELRMSAPSYEAVAEVFAAVLSASAKYAS